MYHEVLRIDEYELCRIIKSFYWFYDMKILGKFQDQSKTNFWNIERNKDKKVVHLWLFYLTVSTWKVYKQVWKDLLTERKVRKLWHYNKILK